MAISPPAPPRTAPSLHPRPRAHDGDDDGCDCGFDDELCDRVCNPQNKLAGVCQCGRSERT